MHIISDYSIALAEIFIVRDMKCDCSIRVVDCKHFDFVREYSLVSTGTQVHMP